MKNLIAMQFLAAGLLMWVAGALAADELPYQKEPFEDLLVAGQPSLDQLDRLAAEGYTTVINLRMPGEFDDFDEAMEVKKLGMEYVHIPVKNIESISRADAQALNRALASAAGPVLLHCTVGWRAGGLLAIERYLYHDATVEEALKVAAEAHMSHATGDVEDWIEDNN